MSEKRKDSKGRILRTGESQRKDGLYQYRYNDIHGKRQTVYSPDLKELREKERAIQRNLEDGIDYAAGKVTVAALVERYISLKRGARYNTRFKYQYVLNLLENDRFGSRRIREIKASDAQQWLLQLHENELRGVMRRYENAHPNEPLPKITPHMLRNTFYTNMANAGMDVKNLQYLMGHANVSVTLNVYTHASYEKASAQMAQILEFQQGKQQSSG